MAAECRECGCPINSGRTGVYFCSPEHRKTWNNRRAVRGAELYDLFMANRFERQLATDKHMWSIMTNLASAYRDADKALRSGRRSWDAKETLARLPMAFGTDGDKR
jgi:hypothetical protein